MPAGARATVRPRTAQKSAWILSRGVIGSRLATPLSEDGVSGSVERRHRLRAGSDPRRRGGPLLDDRDQAIRADALDRRGAPRLLPVVRGRGAVQLVEDPESESPRWDSRCVAPWSRGRARVAVLRPRGMPE